jgi:nitronate monooxygenase
MDLRELAAPVLGAPMAGGPSTPQLASAVTAAGGLGFLAAGYLSAERLAADIAETRALGSRPLGVNLFVPQQSVGVPARLESYREALQPWAQHYGVEPGAPRADDDEWAAKLEVVADMTPEVVSFTFGLPPAAVLKRLRGLGMLTVVTVTTVAEARVAVAAGADALVAQGPDAGGHRGTFNPAVRPADQPLPELISAVVAAVPVPVVAAGGVSAAADAAALQGRGAAAVQVGTALLLADEAGTNAVHRGALHNDEFTETTITRVFSGRYARGLTNAFIWEFDAIAPLGYPEVHHMTAPIRRAAVAAGDAHGTNLWAGTGFRSAQQMPVADIVAGLCG